MSRKTKMVRTFANQLIVGKVQETKTQVTIYEPFSVFPDSSGIQIFPLDKDIIGIAIEEMTIDKKNILYTNDVGEELERVYFEATTNITPAPKQKIIT